MVMIMDDNSPRKIDEIRSSSLNHQAPEFFPSNYALLSPSALYFICPSNLLHCPALISLYSFDYSAHYQPQLQPRYLSTPENEIMSPVTKPFEAKKGLYRNNNHWKRHAKHGIVRAETTTRDSRKKLEWRAKPCTYITENNKHFHDHHQASFEYTRKKVRHSAAKTGGERHALIPLKSDGMETTVMIKNIPIRYNREMLKDFLDDHCMLSNREAKSQNGGKDQYLAAFDFLYLPIDFDTKSNKGYAFVNFTDPVAARKFSEACHDQHWEFFKSNKIRQVYCATLQGIEELIAQFEKRAFPSEDFQPLRFTPARDGSKQYVKETLIGKYKPCPIYRRNNSKSK